MKEIVNEKYENDVEVLVKNDEMFILNSFNNSYREYDKEKTIIDLFEKVVKKVPDNIAIIFENQEMSYRELDEKANSLARILIEKGIGPEVIVGIISDRSAKLIIAILAILKAGGAYLPIDAEYPESRINYILKDSNAKLVLIEDKFKDKVKREIELIDLNAESLYQHNNEKLISKVSGDNLAYVIYTSGTTGNPKGVMIEHKSLVNYSLYAKNNYLNNENLTMAFYTSVSFDLTITSIFSPLISENKVRVYKNEDISSLIEKVFSLDNNNVIKVTPAHLTLLKELPQINKSIKKIIVGGDELKEELANNTMELFADKVEIINEYGPTEGTVGCIAHKYEKDKNYGGSVLIGKPINNFKVYILNEKNNMVPIGMVGEIVISGDGVARGYLNNEKLTSEKFLENPFKNDEKIYKTGDLGKWTLEGNIEYLGRKDDQVKIRGYRIELGEINKIVKKVSAVEDVIVVARENKFGEKELNCYIISENREIIKKIKEEIKKYLPEYMIPTKFMTMETFPLTNNGKVDKKALPEIKEMIDNNYVEATNPLEEELVDLWRELLDMDKIGIDDGFIEVGGHSLIATKMVYKINELYNIDLSLVEFLTIGLTIRELSKLIEEKLFSSISDDELEAMLSEIGEEF